MATLTIPTEDRTLTDAEEISAYLEPYGIWYRRYDGPELPEKSTDEEILAAYKPSIDELMATGQYKTADVINILPDTPNLQVMLDKFNKEHWHDENEVRFIVGGNGIFHINPGEDKGPVFRLEVTTGDMINVPNGTHHWFDLCGDRQIKAIRMFEDPAGWTPHYTDTGVDAKFEPLCFGPNYIPAAENN